MSCSALLPDAPPDNRSRRAGRATLNRPLCRIAHATRCIDAPGQFSADWAQRYSEPFGYEDINSFQSYMTWTAVRCRTLCIGCPAVGKRATGIVSFRAALAPWALFSVLSRGIGLHGSRGSLRTGRGVGGHRLVSVAVCVDGTLKLTDKRQELHMAAWLRTLADDAGNREWLVSTRHAGGSGGGFRGGFRYGVIAKTARNETVFRSLRPATRYRHISKHDRRIRRDTPQ